jgi:hypothetical protein
VRKQYHFWPGARRLEAWDVDRLVDLTAGFPVKDVPLLTAIWELDTAYWGDSASTPRQLAEHIRLVNDVDPSYPIILGADGRVMDGMHRIVRALVAGQQTIRGVQFDVHPEPDHVDCLPDELPYPERATD